MTIKEIAEMTGVHRETVRRAVKDLYPGIIKKGVTTDLDKEQSIQVVKVLRIKELPDLPRNSIIDSNLRNPAEVPTQKSVSNLPENTEAMKEMFQSMISDVVQKAVSQTVQAILPLIQNQPLQIEQDYYSIAGYAKLKKIKLTMSELQALGKHAKACSIENNYDIRKIPDERWGEVGSYHIAILENVFRLED